jgi:hypothetical protein
MRKPIANKYRKGTMKSTLQARMLRFVCKLYYFGNIVSIHVIRYTRSKGSERESEIAKQIQFFVC